jgi:hypothetical protein
MRNRSGWALAVAAALVVLQGCERREAELPVAPYVPSPDSIVTELLALAEVGPDDYVIDLGAGDGRIVIAAATQHGASGLGVEIDPDLVAEANAAAQEHGVADRVRFIEQDLFDTDLSPASVVTMYLLPEVVNALKHKLLRELEPGARVLSHDYAIDGWHEARFVQLDHEDKVAVTGVTRTNLYLYVVPAPVAGRWRVSLPAQFGLDPVVLDLEQAATLIRGRAVTGGQSHDLIAKPLQGRQLEFRVPRLDAAFTGHVRADGIEGMATIGGHHGIWRAEREQGKAE